MQTIEEFIDRLVAEKGYEDKDPEVIAQIKADLLESIGDQMDAMIIANMPENKLPEFEKILDTKDQEKIRTYIREQISDIDEKTAVVLLTFKNSYLA